MGDQPLVGEELGDVVVGDPRQGGLFRPPLGLQGEDGAEEDEPPDPRLCRRLGQLHRPEGVGLKEVLPPGPRQEVHRVHPRQGGGQRLHGGVEVEEHPLPPRALLQGLGVAAAPHHGVSLGRQAGDDMGRHPSGGPRNKDLHRLAPFLFASACLSII